MQKFIILENPPKYAQKTKEKLNFSGRIVEICVETDKICFETSDKKIECFHESKIQNFACVQFETELFLFSMKENKVFHFNGEIEIDGNQISVTKKFFDSNMREKRSIFRIKEDIELENEEFVYDEHAKQRENIKDLTPYKFMESVKAKDFVCARNFLSEKLQNQIEISQLKNFFGNFSNFLPISATEFITLNAGRKNFVQFSLDNSQIDDISIDEL